jgi:uncharacterized lipoprotein
MTTRTHLARLLAAAAIVFALAGCDFARDSRREDSTTDAATVAAGR